MQQETKTWGSSRTHSAVVVMVLHPTHAYPAPPLVDEDAPESLLARREAILHEVRASRDGGSEDDFLLALNVADDPLFDQLLELTRRANDAQRVATTPTWSARPRGMWASVCEATLLGPFPTFDAALAHVRSLPRSCFGAFSWQVGEPPAQLAIGEVFKG